MPFSKSAFSGYPFDRDSDQDDHLQSKLSDIAKRHPEFAEQLDNFCNRTSQRHHHLADDQEFGASFGRSFDDRFGFPFTRDDLDTEKFTNLNTPNQEYYHQNTSYPQNRSHQRQPTTQQQTKSCHPQPQTDDISSHSSEGSSQNPEHYKTPIQQSNTIDLGQKQNSVEDRSQRSMSAPPSNKVQNSNFGKNIPANSPVESMSNNQQHSEIKPTERIIPIQIEGRDTPIIPKNVSSTQSQPHQSYRGTERIFGQRPEQFTQFLNRDPMQFADSWQDFSEEPLKKQHFSKYDVPHYQPQQQSRVSVQEEDQKDTPIPIQRNISQTEQKTSTSHSQPDDEPKTSCQEQKTMSPIEQIQMIQKDVSCLMEQVQQFGGKPRDKQYLYLDEMLTRNLIKLDNIDVQGQEIIRSSRKEAIRCIEKAIGILDAKAALNKEENIDVGKPQESMVYDTGDSKIEKDEEQSAQTNSLVKENVLKKWRSHLMLKTLKTKLIKTRVRIVVRNRKITKSFMKIMDKR
ncbi:hypothetical protein JTB14_030027 [Gonioctena quinquepunctata]|nr:hypothetical protein JTB14_030027 [Gonioctena quinquepunctata]